MIIYLVPTASSPIHSGTNMNRNDMPCAVAYHLELRKANGQADANPVDMPPTKARDAPALYNRDYHISHQ
jgi:hypothetical protein